MPSTRLEAYLDTLERLPTINETDAVRQILNESGIPVYEPLVDFQCTYGGIVQPHGLALFIWGLFHENPHPYSYFTPNLPTYEMEDGHHKFTCCNCHGSDHWYLDDTGALFWCMDPPVATSVEKKFERDALGWEMDQIDEPFFRVKFEQPLSEILPELVPRLSAGLIPEASDIYESIYRLEGVYATVSKDYITCTIRDSESAELLNGFEYQTRKLEAQPDETPSFLVAEWRKFRGLPIRIKDELSMIYSAMKKE